MHFQQYFYIQFCVMDGVAVQWMGWLCNGWGGYVMDGVAV